MNEAACSGYDPDMMFPTESGPGSGEPTYQKLRAICAGCPLRTPCRKLALDLEGTAAASSRWGMYGGWSPRQRARIAEHLYGGVEVDPPEQGDLFDLDPAGVAS